MSRKLPKFIGQNQFKKMLDQINPNCITGCRNYAILMIMYGAGLRNSEVCNLTPADVNFETGLLYIQDGKGGKDRYVPMSIDLKESLEKWEECRPDGKFFFSTMKGGQLNDRYIRDLCYRTSEKARVYIQDGKEQKPVYPHALRHSFATETLNSGDFTIRELQELMGHSDVSTTQVYTHVTLGGIAEKFKNRKSIVK
ncbi:tyrosine-type recombinase/integrase [Tissierella pigra]|uniref:Tyrosine-type recombinase/integrase n=1 Tax=Tissierella pigra TaxID=2607614 RepID=A0A6N7Y4Y3_9FIRM|nr:tyrosine-type recombinase/integrase [Tissierella pigra]MSU03110.1 tyrosine-type recombinase/integrase [Tissierella pigra]